MARVRDHRVKFQTGHLVGLQNNAQDYKLLLQNAIIPVKYSTPIDLNKWYVYREWH